MEAVVLGAITRGVNGTTAAVFGAVTLGIVALAGTIVAFPSHLGGEIAVAVIIPHVVILGGLALVVLVSVAWIVNETGGTVSLKDQKRQLKLSDDD